MRVLVDALSVAPGGGATVAAGLLLGLSESRVDDEYTVLVKDSLLPDNGPWPENVRFDTVGGFARSPAARTVWEQVRLPRLMRTGRHDVLFGVGGFGMMRGSWPQVVIVQNALLYIQEPERSTASRTRTRAQREVQLATLRAGATGICVSSAIRDLLRPHVSDTVRLRVIPNGAVETAVEVASTRNERSATPVILWVGSDASHKNPGELVESLAYLDADQRDTLEVRFAGALSNGSQDALMRRASELGLRSSLVFLGYLSSRKLEAEYRSATLFVSTSRVEASPLPPVEAIANRTPMILSDINAHLEISAEAPFYECGDPSHLARRIGELLRDPDLRRRLADAEAGRLERPTWPSVAQAYREELEFAIGRH